MHFLGFSVCNACTMHLQTERTKIYFYLQCVCTKKSFYVLFSTFFPSHHSKYQSVAELPETRITPPPVNSHKALEKRME